MGFFEKIKAGLTRTKENIGHSFDQLFAGELNDDFYDELEETLILGDMGVDTTMKAVEELRRRVKAEKIKDMEGARTCLRRVLTDMLQVGEPALKLDTTPSVALFIGVNGVGKTTTIGKLSARMKGEGHRVLMAAADTFRAGITGIVLTKLDGSAKGGIVIAIAQELQVPVKFIGVGEGIDDLMPFEAEKFVEALV